MELTLPVVKIEAENLAEGWERAVIACWEQGARIATQYDVEGDPNSRDIFLVLTIKDIMAEPRIHRAMPGGSCDLESYVAEVIEGIHDHWIDPDAGKWQYTYHERMVDYTVPGLDQPINQLDYVVEALTEAPHTRRAQAVIWKPWEDAGIGDPACLQRFWFRIFGNQLVMTLNIRSNDAYKAAFMNLYAFAEIQIQMARRLSEKLGRDIRPGQLVYTADSFHIYGSYFDDFEGFLKMHEARSFEERTYRTDQVANLLNEGRQDVIEKLQQEILKPENREKRAGVEVALAQLIERYRCHPILPMEV